MPFTTDVAAENAASIQGEESMRHAWLIGLAVIGCAGDGGSSRSSNEAEQGAGPLRETDPKPPMLSENCACHSDSCRVFHCGCDVPVDGRIERHTGCYCRSWNVDNPAPLSTLVDEYRDDDRCDPCVEVDARECSGTLVEGSDPLVLTDPKPPIGSDICECGATPCSVYLCSCEVPAVDRIERHTACFCGQPDEAERFEMRADEHRSDDRCNTCIESAGGSCPSTGTDIQTVVTIAQDGGP